jgi:protein associated with RNAse G/E
VGRNESAKLLSSKISKVKIVAEDQLKRVTLAFIKDKEEIKLRNDMQKKFSKKLKNVSNYENSSLAKLKKNYAEIAIKKQVTDCRFRTFSRSWWRRRR